MGFFTPKLPPFDVHFWYWGRRSARLEPMCQHWGEHGFGAPSGVVLLYILKIALYVAGGLGFLLATPGVGGLADIGTWWTDPVVYQKAVLWSLLFEVLGLGCGFGPLTLRFLPPFGGALHWLRPGTIRLPPWPGRVPLTRGTTRTGLDVLLYAALLAALLWPLLSAPSRLDVGLAGPVDLLPTSCLLPFALLLPLIGLRDKTIFLAARAEYYWLTLLAFFLPYLDMVSTIKVLVVLVWWGAALSKVNRMFPYTVAAMFSNAPLPPKFLRRRMFRRFPTDMRPSRATGAVSYFGVLVEFVAPLLLLVSTDPSVTLLAVAVMVLFHVNILFALPMGVPLEWNVFVIFSTCYLFLGHFGSGLTGSLHPLAPALLAVPTLVVIIWGNLRPDQVSFLLSMRYYAGNWGTSLWLVKPSAQAKFNRVVKSSDLPKPQLKRIYGEQIAEVVTHKVFTWRSLHHHGRALFGLLPRAGGATHERGIVVDGELVAGTMLGWDFAEGHLHHEQLVAAVQERCGFAPGELRVVVLESAPMGSDRQAYRLVDAAVGVFERGYVLVKDMLDRQPWEIDNLPVYVLRRLAEVPGDALSDEPTEVLPAVRARIATPPRGLPVQPDTPARGIRAQPATPAGGQPDTPPTGIPAQPGTPPTGIPARPGAGVDEPDPAERTDPGPVADDGPGWFDANEIGPQEFRPLGSGPPPGSPTAHRDDGSTGPVPPHADPGTPEDGGEPRLPEPKNARRGDDRIRHAEAG
jgi:hypothetical protein